MVWRRVRDSNPRFLLREHIISSDAPSTSRTTLRAIFQPNFSNLNLGKWREKLERKLFNLFNCTAKTPINQGFSRRGFQSDHWFSSPQCKMEVNRKNRTLMHFIPLLRKNIDRTSCLTIITSIRTLYKTRFFKRNGGENADNHKSNRCKKPYISRVFDVCYPISQADFESAEQI